MNYEEVSATKNIVKVSLVGVGMRSHAGIAGQMFTCLAKKEDQYTYDINLRN
jgi:aspartate kinase